MLGTTLVDATETLQSAVVADRPMVVVKPVIPHTPGTWRLLYFDAPTRGEQIRVLFAVAQTPFHDVRLHPFPQALEPYKKAAMGDASPLLGTDLCPAVTAPDGTHCIETANIMRFIGQRVGLAPPANSDADKKAMEMCLVAQSVLDKCFYPLLKPMVVQQVFAQECLGLFTLPGRRLLAGAESSWLPQPQAHLLSVLKQVEEVLVASGDLYVASKTKPTYADVALYSALSEVLEFPCFDKAALLKAHPKTAAMLDSVAGKAQAWMELRIATHQHGVSSTMAAFAGAFTPFPWSKLKRADDRATEFVVEWEPGPACSAKRV